MDPLDDLYYVLLTRYNTFFIDLRAEMEAFASSLRVQSESSSVYQKAPCGVHRLCFQSS